MSSLIPDRCAPGWAHQAGLIDLQPVAAVPTELAVLADRLFIIETVQRYAIAYDERRLDILSTIFSETGSYGYQIGDGPFEGRSGRDEVIAWLAEIMAGQTDQRRHMLSSLVIERQSAAAATVIAYKAIYGIDTAAELITTGLYRIELVKDAGRWLIQESVDALDRSF